MPNILTPDQAANALRVPNNDPRLLDLLPQVDRIVERATGRSWAKDTIQNPVAVAAATMLLVMMFDNPAMLSQDVSLPFGLTSSLAQLEAESLKYRSYTFYGLSGPGSIVIYGARLGDKVISLTGVHGATGDRSADFESTVEDAGVLEQTAGSDLSANVYVAILKNPADDVLP
jgi:hypothetical protein